MEENRKLQWFQDARFGLFLHWGIYAVPALGEWAMYYHNINYDRYEKYAEQFNPAGFDPAQWAELAWHAGMRYVVFTTKHHDGFCMYDSKYTDFKITNTPYGRDITAELVTAFRARGFRIGLYHSLVDWRHPHFKPDLEHPSGKNGEEYPERDMAKYRKYLYQQVTQLLSDYGRIDLLFFDYTSKYKTHEAWDAEKLLELVYSLQPEIVVNDRLSYHKTPRFFGDYCTPEISLPNQPVTVAGKEYPWETCMTMNGNWGYNASDRMFKSAETIIRSLIHCTSMNGNLLLNIGPDAKGRFPQESITILKQLAEWMKDNRESIHGTGNSSLQAPAGFYYTRKDEKTIFLHLTNPTMGDVILPGLHGKVKSVSTLVDGVEVPVITHWGGELLKEDELRIRPPAYMSTTPLNTLKIEMT